MKSESNVGDGIFFMNTFQSFERKLKCVVLILKELKVKYLDRVTSLVRTEQVMSPSTSQIKLFI